MADFPDFDAFVEIYEREAEPMTGPFAAQALALADLPAAARLIDVAAGTGVFALAAAQAGARVLATDLAPAMVSRLAARLAAFPGCAAQAMGADSLQAADGTFDAAVSIFGVAILPIWRSAFAELARVTRPGGNIVVAAWPHREGAAPMLVVKDVFERLFPDRRFETPLPAWTKASLSDGLADAGCIDVAVHEVASTYAKPTPERLVDDLLPMFRMLPMIAALPDADLACFRDPLVEAFRRFAGADGVRVPISAWIAVSRKRD